MINDPQPIINPIQWYPGHIAKLERELANLLKPVDVALEIIDARAPQSTRHPTLQTRFLANKPTGLVLNKIDLADPKCTREWLAAFSQNDTVAIGFSATQQGQIQSLVQLALSLAKPLRLKQQAQGLKATKPVKLAILGMPNVGKSSIINRLVHKQKAKTGHQAGVTRQPQWVQIHPELILLDTPGIIPSKLANQQQGELLAILHGVGEDAFDNETVADVLIACLAERYPDLLHTYYKVPESQPLNLEMLALCQGILKTGALADESRMALRLLTDFRHGRLGCLTLETVR